MIRLHYHIADAISECLEKLETGGTEKAKPNKRCAVAESKKIGEALAGLDSGRPRRPSMPAVISAALNERIADDTDSTSVSDCSNTK
jgi:hypothetical protein